MAYVEGRNIIGPETLCRSIADAMVTNGFKVTSVDRVASTTIPETAKAIILSPQPSVDGLIVEQPWSIMLEGNDLLRTMTVNVLPNIQITEDFRASSRSLETEIGRLAKGGLKENYFFDMASDFKVKETADLSSVPMSYNLSITDHGIALCVFIEGHDNTGTSFSWFVAQRGRADSETFPGSTSPLFCVYSIAGGQDGNPDDLVPDSIERFTVIEKDINSASEPISAVIPTPDSYPIINPLQQVSLFEGNVACVLFPQLINTQRYLYFVKMDMLAYTSADVISADSAIEVSTGAKRIRYKAQSANGRDNRGLRILFPETEVGV